MNRRLLYGFVVGVMALVLSLATVFVSFKAISTSAMVTRVATSPADTMPRQFIIPIYDNVWGTIYHAEVRQCDATPTITGDGSRINPARASDHRWIAISQEMLDSQWRVELLDDSTSTLFKGRIQYGDTVWIASPNEAINGWWVVRDTKNKRYRNSIDFLQTKGDATLYNNDKYWNGRFDDIWIFSSDDIKKINPMT